MMIRIQARERGGALHGEWEALIIKNTLVPGGERMSAGVWQGNWGWSIEERSAMGARGHIATSKKS